MIVELSSALLDRLHAEAAAALPEEACGILLGQGVTVHEIRPAANVHPTPQTHFEIDPQALVDAHRAARTGGLQVVGYYHSHPSGPPRPSATDAEYATGDARVWAIIGQSEVGWWLDGPDGFEALSSKMREG